MGSRHGNMEKDDFFGDRFGKGNGDSSSNDEDLNAMHERLKDSFIQRQREHEDYLQEKREMMEDVDYNLGIMPKDKKRKKKEESKKGRENKRRPTENGRKPAIQRR